MRLSSLAELPSFALLGPGFGGGRFLLVTGLRAAAARPVLVHAPFEGEGRAARCLGGEVREVDLQLDVPPRPVAVRLEAAGHARAVARIRQAIAAGDVYQVCYAVRARAAAASGAELLAQACRAGVPRYAAWLRLPGGEELVSASPELFFEIEGRRIHSQPMKGTARPEAAAALRASEKDRAELAMITDLVRNDLAQVCRPRTVQVECPHRVLELPYALQTVSDVTGELARGATPLDALAALHPGGSVTGAPKRAALSLIRELEPASRGAYCGALGFCAGGRATFSLLIRTAAATAEGWTYGVGSGIVHDSDASAELDELRAKLGAMWPTPSSP